MIVLAVVNLKGGTGKTISAVFLAHVLAELGQRVLLVDADAQATAQEWDADAGGFPFPVVGLPTRTLHKQLDGITGDRYDAVVIDTPPLEDKAGVVVSALRIATEVIVPVMPSSTEYKRLARVLGVVEESADHRPSGEPPRVAVLFTRTVASASANQVYRELIKQDGVHVLAGGVARLERFAQADGLPVVNALGTAYGDVVRELYRELVAR
jgi:chromosome partitioning protein